MRGLTSTLILVVVLAGLGGYIYFVDSKKPATSPATEGEPAKEKLFDKVAKDLGVRIFIAQDRQFVSNKRMFGHQHFHGDTLLPRITVEL